MATKEEAFDWPWQYNFPPFFTLQTNADTQSKQIAAWCDLVLSYYRQSKQYILDVTEAQSSPLFHNAVINRKLPLEAVNVVLSSLERKGHVEWEDATKRTRCYVMWRTPEEWAALIFQWVASKGFTNTVCTYYDLHSGDDAADQEFFGMDLWMLKKSLRVLQTQGKAELMQGTQADDSDGGIKFFS
ncbi:vacuolar protein-sorting-associated protein 25-like [Sycon ciliatum]|uniref:vacuolar protein-sorting-associated protein 25-like n=1 Tax=Sycon ciliatum TaxID=27933 RepID=UPI0020AB74F3|eukprot:scpid36662/ scgid11782/ Vacuolar protein-sorting-associated protein 25; ESCRT-II complex subunit VPS25